MLQNFSYYEHRCAVREEITNSGREVLTTKFHFRILIDYNVEALRMLLKKDVRMMLLVRSQSAVIELNLKVL